MKKPADRPIKSAAFPKAKSMEGKRRPAADEDTTAFRGTGQPLHSMSVPAVGTGSIEHKILAASLNGIYIYDLDAGHNIFINPQYTRLTGYTLEDLQSMGDTEFFALFHPDDREKVAAHFTRIGRCADDKTLEIEYRFKTADGRWIWCLSRDAVFERDDLGHVRRLIGTFLDITGRKTAEKKLAQERQLLQKIIDDEIAERKKDEAAEKKARDDLEIRVRERTAQLEAAVTALEKEVKVRKQLASQLQQWSRVFMDATDPIIIEDLSGIIIDMNRAAEREYGWRRNELIGKSIRSLIPSARFQWAERLRERCYQGEVIRNWEGMRRDQQGRIFFVLLTAFPLLDDSGRMTSLATIAKDITQRKQTESELEKTQQRLRELSRKSIEALENDRRTTAKELHDGIGASLAAIKFRLEGIVEEIPQNPSKSAATLDETVSYLQAAIAETKNISAKLRPTILDDLGLRSTITWYIRQLSEQFGDVQLVPQIEIREEDIPETLKIVIYRVLQECLHNAAKHSEAREIQVKLSGGDQQIVLEVADNGCGFDVQHTLGGQDPMAGYGLASMMERAEIAGGSLVIDSSPGKGTRIKMVLSLTPQGSNLPLDEISRS
jgi:PAS domain S-box-containing protein